ncbi:MAG: sodium-dependent transporter [Chitinispirillaceae bacterium]|nr:sodium-dependent transporter [Chitinispirillaceae bacterium]
MPKIREHWGSKLGVILAVAGSAIGLGNFLRFPVKAATYGGGAFLIPYFIALLLVGIPLAWMEWTLGRYGGRFAHGSGPGILSSVVRHPLAKYIGSMGVLIPLLIYSYYVYIESWLVGFAWYSLTGELMRQVSANTVTVFFGDYIGFKLDLFSGVPAALVFYVLTFALNITVVSLGIRRGIEMLSKVAMPVILLLGIALLVRVLTLPGIGRGMAFMWNPDFSQLLNPRVWLEASGQIFFTLSLGIGSILTYASYVKQKQDVALSSLSSCAANEFAEVILGGTIVIPLAVVMFGANLDEIAKMGTFGLGLNTMPLIFGSMPLPALLQFIWFALLSFAGITSSISMLQPPISFFEDALSIRRRGAVTIVAIVALALSLVAVLGLEAGAVDEMDFWGGTCLLVVFGTIEAFIFSWIFGINRGWDALHHGAHITLPLAFKFVMKYVTPFYLALILIAWLISDGWNVIMLRNIDPAAQVTFCSIAMSKVAFVAFIRTLLLAVWAGIIAVIFWSWKYHRHEERINRIAEGGPHA